jgi:hypothetical protein
MRVEVDPDNVRELERARIPRPSFYLLRPDGHVGLAGTRVEAAVLSRYLTERLELRTAKSRSSLPPSAGRGDV